MTDSKSARVRARLNHPVIDADGHWLEAHPIFFDYVREIAGVKAVEYLKSRFTGRALPWYRASAAERLRGRKNRPPFWTLPTNTDDRAATMIPSLLRARLDDWGIDVAVVFPSMGIGLIPELGDAEIRVPVLKAYNTMAADMFRAQADRVIPVGIVAMSEPAEAIELLEHAHSLGIKQVMMDGAIQRRIPEDADWQGDARRRRVYVDGLGIDSAHDYDPVWKKFLELKIPVATHIGSMGWPDRNSPSNFVANHVGHFAQSHHVFARSVFLGGVTRRFPGLNFGFLEGGVGWACNLYGDLMGHWEKRNRTSMQERLRPSLVDTARMRELFERHAGSDPRFKGKIDEIIAKSLHPFEYGLDCAEATRRDLDSGDLASGQLAFDDFARVGAQSKDELRHLFADNFYFGCEADDPMTAVAFNDKMGLRLKPVLGSDIGHFDVLDATEVLEEAYELVEDGLINEDNFRDFTFGNAARLFAGMNPDFFKGTLVEDAVKKVVSTRG